ERHAQSGSGAPSTADDPGENSSQGGRVSEQIAQQAGASKDTTRGRRRESEGNVLSEKATAPRGQEDGRPFGQCGWSAQRSPLRADDFLDREMLRRLIVLSEWGTGLMSCLAPLVVITPTRSVVDCHAFFAGKRLHPQRPVGAPWWRPASPSASRPRWCPSSSFCWCYGHAMDAFGWPRTWSHLSGSAPSASAPWLRPSSFFLLCWNWFGPLAAALGETGADGSNPNGFPPYAGGFLRAFARTLGLAHRGDAGRLFFAPCQVLLGGCRRLQPSRPVHIGRLLAAGT